MFDSPVDRAACDFESHSRGSLMSPTYDNMLAWFYADIEWRMLTKMTIPHFTQLIKNYMFPWAHIDG